MMQESVLPKRVTLTAQQQEALSKIELFLNGNVPVLWGTEQIVHIILPEFCPKIA